MEEFLPQKMPGGRSCGHFFERLIHLLDLFLCVTSTEIGSKLAAFQLSAIR